MRFVLARPQHPGNVGAAARAIKVMGWDELRIVAPQNDSFPNKEAKSRAASAEDVLHKYPPFEDLDAAVGDCAWVVGLSARRRNEGPRVLDIREAAAIGLTKPGPVAWVFGNERYGLSNDELRRCHALVHIPTGPALSSLNLGAAVQVVAYELWRAKLDREDADLAAADAVAAEAEPPATRAEIDAAVDRLWTSMETLEVFNVDGRIDAMRERLRRLMNRATPSSAELRVVHGVVSWIERWKRKTD